MGQIREELVLYDRFTNTFTSYIRMSQQAAGATMEAKAAADQFASSQAAASSAASGLASQLKSLAGAYLGLRGMKMLVGFSDQVTATTARLNLMNDGLQSTKELQDMIFQSAQQARGEYTATAGMVSKLGVLAGDAFGSNREIVAFAEQINKQFTISGTSAAGQQAAMLQLTQAMGSGVLRGEELNSVLEQAPTIVKSIADYLETDVAGVRKLASEGKVSAQVVKAAVLAASDEINAQFASMPMTWGQVWTSFQNIALRGLNPVLQGVSWLAGNIQVVGPLVLGAGGAFGVFLLAAKWTSIAKAATGAYNLAVGFLSMGYGVLTGNTAAASAATLMFNSALWASPVTWAAAGIMLVVGALYAGVAAFNKFAGTSVSATGLVAGTLASLGAFAYNTFLVPVYNGFADLANFMGNVFRNPVAAIGVLFADMVAGVLGWISNLAHGVEDLINNIPGMEVSLTKGVDEQLRRAQEAAQSAKAASGWVEYAPKLDYLDYSQAAGSAYNWGANLNPLKGVDSPMGHDPTEDLLSGIAADTGSIKKAVSYTEEDIRSLVDVAQRQYVNKINLTAQSPVINVTGQNTGNTMADKKAFADFLVGMLQEQAAASSLRTTARVF
jgi:tape measure domain-containing protein